MRAGVALGSCPRHTPTLFPPPVSSRAATTALDFCFSLACRLCLASVASKTQACSPQVLVFLQALLASKKHREEQEATALLKEAAELHFSGMQALPMSSEYLERLDPVFLVCIAKEYLVFCPKQVRGGRFFVGRGEGRGLDWRTGLGRGRTCLASH